MAPVYVERGAETTGVGSNMKRVMNYLTQLENVVNDHATALEFRDDAEAGLRARVDAQTLEIANMKAILAQNDAATKKVLEESDLKLKEDTTQALKAI
jgi:hypothetical protein